ncbi:hypothetical protein FQZ97_1067850 [compost metagenome]
MNDEPSAPGTARSKSASSSRTTGDLPPSSSATRLMSRAASSPTRCPARVDPVKDTMSTSGCPAIASPTSGPVPETRLNAPAGKPISWKISANRNALNGATSEGFSTTVHPAARAGATFAATWCRGKFQGVMQATTPTGSRVISEFLTLSGSSDSSAACAAA